MCLKIVKTLILRTGPSVEALAENGEERTAMTRSFDEYSTETSGHVSTTSLICSAKKQKQEMICVLFHKKYLDK